MEDSWNILDSIRTFELYRRQIHFKAFENSRLFWDSLKDYQYEGIEDIRDFICNLTAKHNLISTYANNLDFSVQKANTIANENNNKSNRKGIICNKILASLDSNVCTNMLRLKTGIECEISHLAMVLEQMSNELKTLWM